MAKNFQGAASQGKSIPWSRKDNPTNIKSTGAAQSHATGLHAGGMYNEGPSGHGVSRTAPPATAKSGANNSETYDWGDDVLYTHQSRQSSHNPAT